MSIDCLSQTVSANLVGMTVGRIFALLYLLFSASLVLKFAEAWTSFPSSLYGTHVRCNTALFVSKEDSQRFKEEAERLRKEVSLFEKEKNAIAAEQRRKIEEEQEAQQVLRERYSAVVPILKPNGETVEERVSFPPIYNDGSFIATCEASLPLGLILGESELFAATTVVDELAPGSNAEAAGVQIGDIVRAFTACRLEMTMPTWQVLAGGIGVPKTKRFMYSADGRPFEEVMEAVASNRQDPAERPMLLVLERRKIS